MSDLSLDLLAAAYALASKKGIAEAIRTLDKVKSELQNKQWDRDEDMWENR